MREEKDESELKKNTSKEKGEETQGKKRTRNKRILNNFTSIFEYKKKMCSVCIWCLM